VTDLRVSKRKVYKLMRGGRARWKIENETFNTLKNQGYNFEHNYGHGEQHLSVVFATLIVSVNSFLDTFGPTIRLQPPGHTVARVSLGQGFCIHAAR
jgi:hypothetical protein